MERVKLHEFVKENLPVIRRLVHAGVISGRIIRHYRLYIQYKERKLPANVTKMDFYHELGDELNISARSVIRAVKDMERTI